MNISVRYMNINGKVCYVIALENFGYLQNYAILESVCRIDSEK